MVILIDFMAAIHVCDSSLGIVGKETYHTMNEYLHIWRDWS